MTKTQKLADIYGNRVRLVTYTDREFAAELSKAQALAGPPSKSAFFEILLKEAIEARKNHA